MILQMTYAPHKLLELTEHKLFPIICSIKRRDFMATKMTKKLTTWGKIWRFVLCVAAPLAVGGLSALLTMNAMNAFDEMNQPPLAPPAWLFPIAWTILYVLMGIASFLIYLAGRKSKKNMGIAKVALIIYGIQLVFNFVWSPLFFNAKLYWIAFAWLIVMWALIIVLMVKAGKISKGAVWCPLPYILWCTFAAYLNCGIAILN